MTRNSDKTCIVTTHRPSVISIADTIYSVKDGEIKRVSKEESLSITNDF